MVVVGEDDSFFPSVGGEIPVFDFHLGGEGGTGIVLVSAGGKVGGGTDHYGTSRMQIRDWW